MKLTTAPRVPRPTRPLPPGRPHRRLVIPGHAARLRRGPTPPDTIISRVGTALERDLDDAPADPRPGDRFKEALALALLRLIPWARRGVHQALPPGPERDAADAALVSVPDPSPIIAAVVASVARSVVNGASDATLRERARGVLEAHLLHTHTQLVRQIAAAAGADRYVWTTQMDQRVRPLHVELEGIVQRWDDPPVSGTDGFRGHPGEPGGCRCMAWPILG